METVAARATSIHRPIALPSLDIAPRIPRTSPKSAESALGTAAEAGVRPEWQETAEQARKVRSSERPTACDTSVRDEELAENGAQRPRAVAEGRRRVGQRYDSVKGVDERRLCRKGLTDSSGESHQDRCAGHGLASASLLLGGGDQRSQQPILCEPNCPGARRSQRRVALHSRPRQEPIHAQSARPAASSMKLARTQASDS